VLPNAWSIADVNFGFSDMVQTQYLEQLSNIRQAFITNKIRLERTKKESDKQKIEAQQLKHQEKFKKVYEKMKIEMAGREQNKDEKGIRFAYVVFRSMDAYDIVLNAYKEVGSCNRCCAMSCFGSCCCSARQAELKKMHFFKKWPKINQASEPDNIKWENLGYSNKSRNTRSCILWLIAIVLIIASLIGIVIMKNRTTELKQEFKLNVPCPETVSKEQAWSDMQLPEEFRTGLIACYCKPLLPKLALKIFDHEFTEFQIDGVSDTNKYCGDWTTNYLIQNSLVVGTSMVVVIINIIVCTIFEKIAAFEKSHTSNDETISQFQKITIMQFINIAVVILLVNFDSLDGPFLGFIPILNGEYKDFTAQWYEQVGKTLCLTLFINIFSPHASKIMMPFMKLLFRCLDRGCSSGLKGDKGEDSVKTKKLIQSDLQTLYTGD
jgi:hypothetical protein